MLKKPCINHTERKSLILIIDQNASDLKSNGVDLHREGIDTFEPSDPSLIVDIVNERLPDLILLDLQFPDINYYKICKQLQNREETKNIPVIFLADKITTNDVNKANELGFVDYLIRPYTAAMFLLRVKTHLRIKGYRDEIEKKNKLLQKLNVEKNEILGMTAHDMKNPIFNISMLAKVIRDEKELTAVEVKEFAQDIIETSDRMIKLLTNLLDLNKIEQGQIKFAPEILNVNETIKAAISSYKDRAAKKNIRIKYDFNAAAKTIFTDFNAVMQVLDNLISNAVKYSPPGKSIYLNVDEDQDSLKISVKDEGPGISKEDMKRLFKKFAKLSAKPTGNEDSTGLGLSIVKRYAEMMNGRIYCESELGKGAAFILDIPKTAEK